LNSETVNRFASLATLLGFVASILSFLVTSLPVAEYLPQVSSFIGEHIGTIYSSFVLLALLYLYLTYFRLNRRLTIGFRDKFKGNLDRNWEYRGEWTVQEKGTLCVRSADEGGITKVGALWENYDFSFRAKIINKKSGWIVRAQDINNYFMFQCEKDILTPHQRLAQPIFQQKQNPQAPGNPILELTGYNVGWRIFPSISHNLHLDDWFNVRIRVRGSSVEIYINSSMVFHSNNFITIPMGRVGFRCWGDEESHFRNVRVELIE